MQSHGQSIAQQEKAVARRQLQLMGLDVQVLEQATSFADIGLVEAGDARNGQVEILEGLSPGDEIISQNGILLKPVAAASLRTDAQRTP